MRTKIFLVALWAALGCVGCVDETYFGESSQANITAFSIEGAMSTKIEPLVDWRDVGTVTITVPMAFDPKGLKVTDAVCSQLAHFEVDPMGLTDFSQPVELFVQAEKKEARKRWIVTVNQQQVEQSQLPFSDFTQWAPAYKPGGVLMQIKDQPAYWPGNGSDESPWQTSAQGNDYGASVGIKEFSSVPIPQLKVVEPITADYARVHTIAAGKAAQGTGTGMAAGGIFTGIFAFEPTYVMLEDKQPRKMMNAGVPFYSRPIGVQFDVRYKGGAKMVDGKMNPISWPQRDSCDILFALQNRLGNSDQWVRVATASLRTPQIGHFDDETTGFVRHEMPFIYGRPTAEQIQAKPYEQLGGSLGELFFFSFVKQGDKWVPSEKPITEVYAEDPAAVDVDHIVVMFSSSAYGDLFKAAVGSTLDIKNVKLIYEKTED